MIVVGFTPHTGSGMPCDPKAVVTVKFRNGEESYGHFAELWRWELRYGVESSDDIVGYFVHPDPEGDFISEEEVDAILKGDTEVSRSQRHPNELRNADEYSVNPECLNQGLQYKDPRMEEWVRRECTSFEEALEGLQRAKETSEGFSPTDEDIDKLDSLHLDMKGLAAEIYKDVMGSPKPFHEFVEEAINRAKEVANGRDGGICRNDLRLVMSHLDILATQVQALEHQLSWTIKQKDQYENLLAKYEAERKEA